MNMDEYQHLAARTINRKLDFYEKVQHGVFGLTAEAGEVASLYQKNLQGHIIDPEYLVKELGDVLWMIAEICTAYDISMDYVAETNINKLRMRYPEGFTEERSLHRKDGDV